MSLSRVPQNNSVADIFGSAAIGNVWIWQDNRLIATESVTQFNGHWVYVLEDIDVQVSLP